MAGLMAGLILPAQSQGSVLAAPQTVVGPTSNLVSLSGMSIARDGTGGLVFLEKVAGVPRVFASRLIGGVYQPPVQLDAGLPGASSQPAIAAGNGGVVLVAFINGGDLYVTQAASSAGSFSTAVALYPDAASPVISISNFGKAYLAFTAAAGGGDDVDVAYDNGSSWAFASGPLNVTPGDDAGTGLGRPAVITAGDGVGVVAWGEAGHVFSRRIWATAPSTEYEQLDPATFGGENEVSADSPAISAGGDSSYPDIVFREGLRNGTHTQERVLLTRLIAEDTEPAVAIDDLSASSTEGAGQPAIAMNEYGRGFATVATTTTDRLMATQITTNGAVTNAPFQPDPTDDAGLPYAVPGLAGLSSTLISWQQTTAPATPQIELAVAPGGSALGAPMPASDPSAGPTQAADGLTDGGDVNGDATVAWIQGSGGTLSLDTAQLYVGPGQAAPTVKLAYTRTNQPVLSWSAAREAWGAIEYSVTLGGTAIGQTTATSMTVPAPLVDGPHVFQITATNAAGLQSTGPTATIFVDTVAPRVRAALTGRNRIGDPLTLHVSASDAPAPEVGAQASGVATISLSWGDGSKAITASKLATAKHTYLKPGLFRIKLRLVDRAGNPTAIARYVRILPL